MLSSRERLQERQGQHAAPRHEYLQQLVDEFQRSPDPLRKEEVVANLANFAYDPINYASLTRLRIIDLFLDILDADQEQEERPAPARPTQLVEFALGGICNCIPDPLLQQQFLDGEGLDIVAPYVTRVELSPPASASQLNVSVWALSIAYFLLDSTAFADVSERFTAKMRLLEGHPTAQIAHTASAFLRRGQELLTSP